MDNDIEKLDTLSFSVFDSVYVSDYVLEWTIVGLITERLITWDFDIKNDETVVSVAEYRKILHDDISTDKDIARRLRYLEAFCKNIIKSELQYVTQPK